MILLLYTSSAVARLGLARGGRLVARGAVRLDRRYAEALAGRIRMFLRAHRASPRALQRIMVNVELPATEGARGKGSLTGLRISVTTANVLAAARGIPVIGVRGKIRGLDNLLKLGMASPAPRGVALPRYARQPKIG